jgi:hypothetical protein
MIRGAVTEADRYPRDLCNQHCKTHIYIKEGRIYDQATGELHDCVMTRIAKMFEGHYNMIPIDRIVKATALELPEIMEIQESYNKRWALAFDKWKETGIVPKTKEVAQYII